MSETRVTDPATGGMKGQKDCELGAIDPTALMELGNVAGYGGKKYARSNYLKGYKWSLNYDAMNRHMLAFWSGEELDPESGMPHMAHAAWHALALTSFAKHKLGTDDRWTAPKPTPKPEPNLVSKAKVLPYPISVNPECQCWYCRAGRL